MHNTFAPLSIKKYLWYIFGSLFTKSSSNSPFSIMVAYSFNYRCRYVPGVSIVSMSIIFYASMAEVIIIASSDTIGDASYSFLMCCCYFFYLLMSILWSYHPISMLGTLIMLMPLLCPSWIAFGDRCQNFLNVIELVQIWWQRMFPFYPKTL